MSFVTANRWSQVSYDRQTRADLRFIDASPVTCTSFVATAASPRLTATV
ncbi:hypothetical protein MYSE111917_09600 [Mycobacterium senriense]|nr:hypothetical protein [Mycobacterium senriense]